VILSGVHVRLAVAVAASAAIWLLIFWAMAS
jgi:hypothetical protein